MTKYIFHHRRVISGLGKGIAAASIGRLLESHGYRITIEKLDPYLNVDPGTMSPFQHGKSTSPTTVRRRTWTSATTSGSLRRRRPRPTTGRPGASTSRSSARSARANTSQDRPGHPPRHRHDQVRRRGCGWSNDIVICE